MQCPSCGKSQPMSFKCRHCGAQLVKRPGPVARPAGAPPPAPRAAAAAVALDNPYQAPEMAGQAPVRVSYGEQALAGRLTRLGAQIADVLIAMLAYIPFIAAGGFSTMASSTPTPPPMGALTVTGLLLLGFAGAQIFFLARDGQTLGKKALKIRIVRYDDGGNPGFIKAVLLRLFLNGLLGIIPFYAFVDILLIFGTEKRCIHDLIAGTKVVTA